MDQPACFFKALADPTRLRIMNLLLRSSFCVCEMERILKLPQPLLSRHLAYLRNCGLVESQRDGMRVNYEAQRETSVHQAVAAAPHWCFGQRFGGVRRPAHAENRRLETKGIAQMDSTQKPTVEQIFGMMRKTMGAIPSAIEKAAQVDEGLALRASPVEAVCHAAGGRLG